MAVDQAPLPVPVRPLRLLSRLLSSKFPALALMAREKFSPGVLKAVAEDTDIF